MNLLRCFNQAKENGYRVIELNEYSLSQDRPAFAKIKTVENIIEREVKYKKFADADWQFKYNVGKIWCDDLGITFYLWTDFPVQAAQFSYGHDSR